MEIEKVSVITDEIVMGVQYLVPYLGKHKPIPSRSELIALVEFESSTLFVARSAEIPDQITGMLTICVYRVPTGIRSIVEDVVVDENFRGKGIARALIQASMDFARLAGAGGVALTSNPQRVEANRLYLSVGFQKRETNSYYYKF